MTNPSKHVAMQAQDIRARCHTHDDVAFMTKQQLPKESTKTTQPRSPQENNPNQTGLQARMLKVKSQEKQLVTHAQGSLFKRNARCHASIASQY